MGATFGGGSSSGTVFGGSGAGNFLSRMTVVAAVVFMLTSMTLAYLSSATGVDSLKAYSSDQKTQAKEKRKTHEDILKNFGAGTEGETEEAASESTESSSEAIEAEAGAPDQATDTEAKTAEPNDTTNNNVAPKAESKPPTQKAPVKNKALKKAETKIDATQQTTKPSKSLAEDAKSAVKDVAEKAKEAAPTKDVIPSEVPKELPKAPVDTPKELPQAPKAE